MKYTFNTIKFSLIVFLAVFVVASCNKQGLDLKILSDTEETFYTSEIRMDKGIIGIYAKLTDVYGYAVNNPKHELWMVPGDDLTTLSASQYELFSVNRFDSKILEYYKGLYIIVNRANTMLDIINKKASVYTTANLKDTHIGEAYFMRGWANFMLWNIFGTSPLDTARIQSVDAAFKVTNSKGTELLDQAIADFKIASDKLPPPSSWSGVNLGRATKNAANGFLGKALVFKASIKPGGDAALYAEALTAMKKITGRTLTTDYMDNFSAKKENNSESLFEYQAATKGSGDNVWLDNDFNGPNTQAGCYWGFFNEMPNWLYDENGIFRPTSKLINAYEAGDPRLAATINNTDPAKPKFLKYVTDNAFSTNPGIAGVGGSINNPRILRYADVLLLMAEATLRSGGSKSEAIGYINQIRTRARGAGAVPANRNASETDAAKIMDWIMTERFLELSGEDAHRWLDLRRWHMGGVITLNNAFFDTRSTIPVSFDPSKHLLMPIPEAERLSAPKLEQNSGY